jgi:hypothetical protein
MTGHDEHREGLEHDLPTMQHKGMVARARPRRSLLGLMGGVGALALVGCGSDGSSSPGAATGGAGAGNRPTAGGGPGGQPPGGGSVDQTALDTGDIPEETGGPFPADGSNGVDVLSESGIVRRDIRSSFGDADGLAEGVPLSIRLTVYDNSGDQVTPYAGAAVYLWHCDREGRYSLYSDGATEENYSTADGYGASVANLAAVSLDSDLVFSDGHSLQMGRLTGSVDEGYQLRLNVPV